MSLARLAALAVAAVFCASSARAQWLITEISTGAVDFVEIRNVSGAPRPILGVGVQVANNASCPAVTPGVGPARQNGGYVATSSAVIPDGGAFVFEDLGSAGSTTLTPLASGGFSPGVDGERTGFNFSWASGSHGEVALFEGATLGGPFGVDAIGTAVDYVAFASTIVGGAIPYGEGHRYDPPGTGGLWLSGPFERASGLDVLFRVQGGGPGGFAETNSNADWNASSGPHTGGAANPAGTPGVKTPGVDLSILNDGSLLSLVATTADPTFAGKEAYALISLQPTTCAGSGLILGLSTDVFGLLFLPLPSDPFHVSLDGSGNYAFLLPTGGMFSIDLEARFLVLDSSTSFVVSNYVYASI
jgi:hypothetical protein